LEHILEIRLASRVRELKPSATLALAARAAALRAAGEDIISLSAGEPDFNTPEHIKQAAIEAMHANKTHYTPVDGTPELKAAIIGKFKRENGLDYVPEQILVSCGAKHSLFNLCQALLEAGDEAIIPAPYWVSYSAIVELAGATTVPVFTGIERGFKLSPEALEEAITSRTRLIILNSPSNPTGQAYTRAELTALGEVLRRHPDVIIATDDIYEHIVWADGGFVNIVDACPDLSERTVVINGVSKAYSMTGWRIGYAGGPKSLIQAMKNVQSQSTSNPSSISQAAACAALEEDQRCVRDMCAAFEQRHEEVYRALAELPGLRCLPADGTFYLFPEVTEVIQATGGIDDDTALCEHLLQACGIALVPGTAFGAPGYLRLSFATNRDNLKQAISRLSDFLTDAMGATANRAG
jgi:aspartate aminotransferase